MADVDIFNPQTSVVAKGLEGKTIMIYGGNNLGKTFVASKLSKPYFIATESGLNAISGVNYNRISTWGEFKKVVNQLTSKATVEKARELYNTIVIDEVYASSIECQDFVISTYGEGALSLGDGQGKVNLYQMYEKEYFRMINLLLSCNYTVVFIGHAIEKDGYVTPKGDKRCLNPIIDNCDFVIYLTSNGVDENGRVVLSDGHVAETNEFFARSRFSHCPTTISPFTAENLEKTVAEAVALEEQSSGIKAVTYEEQKEQNTSTELSYDDLMSKLQELGMKFNEKGQMEELTDVVENILGAGKRVCDCTKKQTEALSIILSDLGDRAKELGI